MRIAAGAAAHRLDDAELNAFLEDWLDAKVTPDHRDALVEVLLSVDPDAVAPNSALAVLATLRTDVVALARQLRRDNGPIVGLQRGAGMIVPLDEGTTTHRIYRLGMPDTASVEDIVLNRLQPDVDPRRVELVKRLPAPDQAIAMMKVMLGCSWPAAARYCDQPAARGETVRRRLDRQANALMPSTDPWAAQLEHLTPVERRRYGRLQPACVASWTILIP